MKPFCSRAVSTAAAVCLWLLLALVVRAGEPITYAGGDGSSIKEAVLIKGATEKTGVRAEYDYLSKHYSGYHRGDQSLIHENDRSYDRLTFTTAEGEKRTVFFDITEYFGKFD